jgi:twitching motility protein PilT
MSTLHTIDAAKTVERIVGVFPMADQHGIRSRLSKAFRFIVSQRLLPKKDGKGRIDAVEILKSTMRTREYIQAGEAKGTLHDAMNDGTMEHADFDGEIEKLIREGVVDFETGISYSSNAGNLRLEMADYSEEQSHKTTSSKASEKTEIEIER